MDGQLITDVQALSVATWWVQKLGAWGRKKTWTHLTFLMNKKVNRRDGIAQLLRLPRWVKRLIVLAIDIALCVLTVWLALSLRLEQWVILRPLHGWAMAAAVLTAIPLFTRFGLYRAIFRFAGVNMILSLINAMALYSIVYVTVFAVIGEPGVPRAFGVIQPMLLLAFVGASRVLARYWLGGLYRSALQLQELPGVLIYGAGSSGRQLAAALARSQEHRLLGFLDDDNRLWGNTLDGRNVYQPDELGSLIPRLKVTDVLLAMPSVSREKRLHVLDTLRQQPVHVHTLPGVADMASGRVDLSDVQDLGMEDLLGREPVKPDAALISRNTFSKVVLVTGAGGSIGSELCRQIVKYEPKILLLVESSEFSLYKIHRELIAKQSHRTGDGDAHIEIKPLLGSVDDAQRMQEIMSTWLPDTVYHAAAYKHVPLVEHNPAAGVRNNVWGTWVCAQAAARSGVKSFTLISTDKAVRPTNVMGASKRLAEMVLQAMTALGDSPKTCFSMVRFGNVLDSSGSVVPLFREQIKNGGPITLTHPDINRYFMTIPEAAQLVIQASAMAVGGDVFVLDMGQPVRIYDLAKRMVKLSGLQLRDEKHPNGDIEIQISGLRPGEKLYEELLIGNNPQPTEHERIMKEHEDCPTWSELQSKLETLKLALDINDVPAIKVALQQLVHSYQPADKVVDWVYLAKEEAAKINDKYLQLLPLTDSKNIFAKNSP